MENENLDSVNEYFKHLGQITREVNREELSALWTRVKKGDKAAKNKMMEMNLRLVIPTAKRFQRPGMELMDFWASLEHKLRYKKNLELDCTEEIEKELKMCADTSALLDEKMQKIKDEIEKKD